MKVVAGNARGTGATLYVCCGFVPDWVKVITYGDAGNEMPWAHWTKYFAANGEVEGFSNLGSDADAHGDLEQEAGISAYVGGTLMTTTTQPSVTYGNASVDYVTWDDRDYRYASGEGPFDLQDSAGSTIDTYTVDTAGSWTGHFNDDVTGTYIGAGSRICIAGNWYSILVLTGGQGVSSDEVELSGAPMGRNGNTLTSATVSFIGGMYGNCGYPVARNSVAPAGFRLNAITNVNVSGEMFMFEAGVYDQ